MAKKKTVAKKAVKQTVDWKFVILLTAMLLVGLSILGLVSRI